MAGYLALLRHNVAFRRLWYSQVTSELGDWLDFIALSSLLLNLTGSGEAVGGLVVAQYLPTTLVGMTTGPLLDRWPRKLVLIGADLGRALLVLLFLFVHDASQVWIIYVVMVFKESLTALYEPAREAVIPGVTQPEELIAANAISGVTWSMMAAGGAALGGVVTGLLGTDAAFLLDSLSFVVSALITVGVAVRELPFAERASASIVQGMREGFGYLLTHRDVALYAISKALWGVGGGVLVVITLFGREVFPLGKDGALGIGLLYAARGVGAGIGPILGQRLGGTSIAFLRRGIGPGFLLMGLGYICLSGAPNLGLAALALMLAHSGGSIQWVYSSALLQMTVPHRLLGRVFAVELALHTLTLSISSYLVGMMNDSGWTPRTLALVCAAMFIPSGIFMGLALWRPPADGEKLEGISASVPPPK